MWDDNLKILLPPMDTTFNLAAANQVMMVCFVLITLVFVYGLRHWQKHGSPIVLLILLGGFTNLLAEPFLDIIGAARPSIASALAYPRDQASSSSRSSSVPSGFSSPSASSSPSGYY